MTRGLLLSALCLAILAFPLGCRRSSRTEPSVDDRPTVSGTAGQPGETVVQQTPPAAKPAPSLPADYPKDVPIWPKAELTSSTVVGKKMAVRFETESPVSEVVSFYSAALPREGWEVLATTSAKSGAVIGATKSGRTLDVIIAKSEQATLITLGLSER